MITVADAQQLSRDADSITRFAHASFEDVVDAQCFTDLSRVHLFVTKRKDVSSRNYFQFLDLREIGDDVFGHAGAEVVAVALRIHVFEVENSDRLLWKSLR